MKINHSSYSQYIASLAKQIQNQMFFSPILLNNETLIFPFQSDPNKSLVISLNHYLPLIYIIKDRDFFSSNENAFYLKLKKLVGKMTIKSFSLSFEDMIVNIEITNDNIGIEKNYSLIVELIPLKPNLIVINEDKNIELIYSHDDKRQLTLQENYVAPIIKINSGDGEAINEEIIKNHFNNEITIRRKERYNKFLKYINGKIKTCKNKIKAINNDIEKANINLEHETTANEILCLGLDFKKRQEFILIDGKKINLDPKKTLSENIEMMFKKAKKARETIYRSNKNIESAKNEIKNYENMLNKFENSDESHADKIVQESGMLTKKKEIKETEFNRPYKINYNGTIIYFGKNASQNDYLSFVMKINREYTWLHIKDKSGSHLIIANVKPTNKEIEIASQISILCSHLTSGQVIYTKKKNIHRGKTLGEAIIKNYLICKINNISEEAKLLLNKAERLK